MSEFLSWHQAGQRVVCIDDRPTPNYPAAIRVEKDAVYTIAEVLPDDGAGVCFGLVELKIFLPCIGGLPAWRASRFRPVRETSIEQFRALMNPTPERRNIVEGMPEIEHV